jgi:hypothetical protein
MSYVDSRQNMDIISRFVRSVSVSCLMIIANEAKLTTIPMVIVIMNSFS